MDLWHLNSVKVAWTLWTLNYVCVPFPFLFLVVILSILLIIKPTDFLKKSYSEISVNMPKTTINLVNLASSRGQLTFYHKVPRNPRYSFYWPRKDEWLSRPWSHRVVLNTGPLNCESSALTTRPLHHLCKKPLEMFLWLPRRANFSYFLQMMGLLISCRIFVNRVTIFNSRPVQHRRLSFLWQKIVNGWKT